MAPFLLEALTSTPGVSISILHWVSLSLSHIVIDQGQDKLRIAMKAGRELAERLMKQALARSGLRDTRTTAASETNCPPIYTSEEEPKSPRGE